MWDVWFCHFWDVGIPSQKKRWTFLVRTVNHKKSINFKLVEVRLLFVIIFKKRLRLIVRILISPWEFQTYDDVNISLIYFLFVGFSPLLKSFLPLFIASQILTDDIFSMLVKTKYSYYHNKNEQSVRLCAGVPSVCCLTRRWAKPRDWRHRRPPHAWTP